MVAVFPVVGSPGQVVGYPVDSGVFGFIDFRLNPRSTGAHDAAAEAVRICNQIEVWFSILVRKLLSRSSFTSQAHLKAKILAFVDYFNRTLAKPFKWNYTGKPLTL